MFMCFKFFLLVEGASRQQDYPTADTALGRVKGHYKYSYHKRIYSAFEGLPYAKPPVGDLRFEEPQDAEPWNGVLEATKLYECVQNIFSSPVFGEEDCLYINVYVPRTNPLPNEKLDVFVHIHGGAFIFGGPLVAGSRYMMDRDIIYINFNYRLGIFGFLSTGDEALPGNIGLKDQVFALKWIQKNIKYFGGNPNSVTLLGLSSGSACAHFHYFSPLSKGLFHRAVLQSGTAVSTWSVQLEPLKQAIALGKAVDCNNSTSKELANCLKSKSTSDLYKQIQVFYSILIYPLSAIAPVIEKKSSTAFLTEHPYILLKKGEINKVPILTSSTTDEGIIGLRHLNNDLNLFIDNYDYILPYLLDYYNKIKEDDKPIISEKIKDFYFENGITTKSFIRLVGDRTFKVPLDIGVRMHAKIKETPIYIYIFAYESSFRSQNWHGIEYEGVDHAEDGYLLYDISLGDLLVVPEKLSDSDVVIKDILLHMLVSFARDGAPKYNDINWTSVKEDGEIDYLFIKSPDSITMKSTKEFAPTSFWSSLPIKEFDKLIDVKEEL
ncbi:hypothetical protein RN001_009292 [Aquatica leii]|uniref:Carboxylic ester hydrolase n=1 Tax=Aquatica leii TaxID=1421715 RepID=A0AAN7P8I0_9COLE|nr:hypothetical protein RN001_009292 [Aquatica leii]